MNNKYIELFKSFIKKGTVEEIITAFKVLDANCLFYTTDQIADDFDEIIEFYDFLTKGIFYDKFLGEQISKQLNYKIPYIIEIAKYTLDMNNYLAAENYFDELDEASQRNLEKIADYILNFDSKRIIYITSPTLNNTETINIPKDLMKEKEEFTKNNLMYIMAMAISDGEGEILFWREEGHDNIPIGTGFLIENHKITCVPERTLKLNISFNKNNNFDNYSSEEFETDTANIVFE